LRPGEGESLRRVNRQEPV